jgi:hypothetical protein
MTIKTKFPIRSACAMILGFAVCTGAITTAAAQDTSKPAHKRVGQNDGSRELCSLVVNAISALPARASVADLEAAVVFAISQAPMLQPQMSKRDRDRLVELALTCALGSGKGGPNLAAAIANVRSSYGIGTGAVRVGGSFNGGAASSFTLPLVGIGGGSTNYSSAR